MSDFRETLNENAGYVDYWAGMAACQQRKQLLEDQKLQSAEMQKQNSLLEKQNQIEQDRAKLEKQRLEIEQLRAKAEASEREQRRLQAEQIKQVRLLMADCLESIGRLKKLKPTP
jgi:hypothetical protein